MRTLTQIRKFKTNFNIIIHFLANIDLPPPEASDPKGTFNSAFTLLKSFLVPKLLLSQNMNAFHVS